MVHDGHHQSVRGPDGDAQVDEVLVDDLVTADLRVDRGNLAQRRDAGAGEEGHEAEPDAVRLAEAVLVLRPERQHAAHVDLVEGREDGGGPLRLHEALGDPLADTAHRHALLTVHLRERGRLRRLQSARGGLRRDGRERACGGRLRGAGAGEMGEDVFLGEPAALARGRDDRRIEVVLGDEPAHRRTERPGPGRAGWRGGRGPHGRGIGVRFGDGGRRRRRHRGRGPCRRSSRGVVEERDDIAHRHSLSLLFQDAQDPGISGRELRAGLVGLELEQHVVRPDQLAVLLRPAHDDAFRHRFAEVRDTHLVGHAPARPSRSVLSARRRSARDPALRPGEPCRSPSPDSPPPGARRRRACDRRGGSA